MAVKIQLTKGYVTVVDECDADLINLKWTAQVSASGNTVYAFRKEYPKNGKPKNQRLHRVIVSRILGRELLPNEQVDHVDGDGLNNRRSNLRLATRSQNGWNTSKHNNNKSGYKGVSPYGDGQKWVAQIAVNGKKKHLGYFNTPEAAHEAYCIAAKELHGDFANFG